MIDLSPQSSTNGASAGQLSPLSRHEQRLANNRASLRRFWDQKGLENERMWAERAALVRDAFARGLTRRQVEAETGWARGTLATVVKRMRAAGEVVKGARVKPKAKLSLTVGAFRRWTEPEDAYLIRWWGRIPDQSIMRKLDRSSHALRNRTERIHKISRRENLDLSASDVGRVFGVTNVDVARWLRRGLLAGVRGGFRTGKGIAWSISEDALDVFIRDHGYLLDPARIPDAGWRELVEEAQREQEWVTLAEITSRIGYGDQTLQKWIRRGLLPAWKRGRPWQYVARWRDVGPARAAHEAGVTRNLIEARRRRIWRVAA